MINDIRDVALLCVREGEARRNIVPFCQTAPTTGRRGVLSNKHRVTAHRGLFAVVLRLRGRKPLSNKISRVPGDNGRALINAILPFFGPQTEARTKRRA